MVELLRGKSAQLTAKLPRSPQPPHDAYMPFSDAHVTAALVACGAVVALLPAVWPFFYVASPVPEPFDCLPTKWDPYTFDCWTPNNPKILHHNFDTCWIQVPTHSHPLLGLGMFGWPPKHENDDNFTALFVLYVLAVAVSCVGAVVSSRMILRLRRSGTYHSPHYRGYLRALVLYFLMQTLLNFCSALAFVENRCHYHNVDLRRPHLHGVAVSPWFGRPETEPNPAGSYVARVLSTYSTTVGGLATNVVLELVLVRKARMLEGVDHLRRLVKAIAWFVVAQLLLLLVYTVAGFFFITLPILMEEPTEHGIDFSKALDFNGDGKQDENVGMASLVTTMCFALVHVFVSVALCYVFVKLLTTAQRRNKVGPGGGVAGGGGGGGGGFPPEAGATIAPKRGRTQVARTAVVRRVTISTAIAVFSTLLCYGNFGASFTSWPVMLAIDSIINDACLLCVAVASEVDDAATAEEAELETLRDVITTTGPFKLLSWRALGENSGVDSK